MVRQCERAASILDVKARSEIDCRADESGNYYLFDVNMKPNMTGASRFHRKDQDSLSAIAARGIGWTYNELVHNIFVRGGDRERTKD
ncbi:MAG: hypothetical protein HKN87_15710 [Saprospiraceae bacterium]|nr:hypothetical protein [Saprospiraceae bacterium]